MQREDTSDDEPSHYRSCAVFFMKRRWKVTEALEAELSQAWAEFKQTYSLTMQGARLPNLRQPKGFFMGWADRVGQTDHTRLGRSLVFGKKLNNLAVCSLFHLSVLEALQTKVM